MALGEKIVKPADQTSSALARYERLMSLTVRHDFYGEGAACPDFAITPTAATHTLLQNLKLLAKPRRAGIDILYCTRDAAAMLRYFWDRRDRRQPGTYDLARVGQGSWSRLALAFTLRNPLFTNFTEMPLWVRPGTHCLYLSNRVARLRDGRISLTVDESNFGEMPEITFSPTHLAIQTPNNAAQVVVYGTSGRAILLADKDFDAVAALPPHIPESRQPDEPQIPTVPFAPGGDIQLDMAKEPPGRYSYAVITEEEKKKAASLPGPHGNVVTSDKEKPFLYAGTSDAPLVMVDLFFASPDEPVLNKRCYPIDLPEDSPKDVTDLDAQKHIARRDYEIRFQARKTIWTYYIVLPQGSAAANGLAIEAVSPHAPPFDGPHAATLAGVPAHQFAAKTPYPLQSRSDVWLRLRAADAPGGGSSRILLDRLPLPSAESISPPQRSHGKYAASDVFVYL